MRSLFQLLSPSGARARLPIFIFHRVLARPDPLFPHEMTYDRFDGLCRWLREWFHVLPLDQAVRLLAEGELPARAACITFDDGYADNHDVALPILQRHGLSGAFFVATGFLDGGRMWNDTIIETLRGTGSDIIELDDFDVAERLATVDVVQRRHALERAIDAAKYMPPDARSRAVDRFANRFAGPLPDDLMMTSAQVRAMRRAGMVVGAHTVSHPILARIGADEAAREIEVGRETLQTILDERVGLFAYPNGKPGVDYLSANVAQVQAMGFDAAFSTEWAVAHAGSDRNQLPRFTPWDARRTKFGLRVAKQMWATRPRDA
jgi:peptidoglycan/xylan/chitin deacetylase (PgdA/CDA1 family)